MNPRDRFDFGKRILDFAVLEPKVETRRLSIQNARSFNIAAVRFFQSNEVSMPLPVKLEDVVEALDNAAEGHAYYLNKRTGEVVLVTDDDMQTAEDDELISKYPDWQRESILNAREVLKSSEHFGELPAPFDIHEYGIIEDFCRGFENRAIGERLLRLIKGAGAFRLFKNEINSLGIEEDWYKFKRSKLEEIAIEWLEENRIPFGRQDADDVSERSRET